MLSVCLMQDNYVLSYVVVNVVSVFDTRQLCAVLCCWKCCQCVWYKTTMCCLMLLKMLSVCLIQDNYVLSYVVVNVVSVFDTRQLCAVLCCWKCCQCVWYKTTMCCLMLLKMLSVCLIQDNYVLSYVVVNVVSVFDTRQLCAVLCCCKCCQCVRYKTRQLCAVLCCCKCCQCVRYKTTMSCLMLL